MSLGSNFLSLGLHSHGQDGGNNGLSGNSGNSGNNRNNGREDEDLGHRRKISLSFISEMVRTNSNDALRWDREEGRRRLQRRILRTQIVQVVLGLTLMVTTAVALIEQRTIFGLGFGIFSAIASIISAVLGMVDWKARLSGAINGVAFLTLIPTSVFMILSLHDYFASNSPSHNSDPIGHHMNTHFTLADMDSQSDLGSNSEEEQRKMSGTVPILFLIELIHIIPIGFAFIYNVVLFRHLHTYQLI